jgi:hypothetical protein
MNSVIKRSALIAAVFPALTAPESKSLVAVDEHVLLQCIIPVQLPFLESV